MKKILFSGILALAMFATSCKDDEATASVPVLGELTLTPDTVFQGDQITARIKVADEGENSDFFNFKYNYNDGDPKTITDFSRDSADNIVFRFTAPKINGRLRVAVSATATLYAGSQLYKPTNSVKATIIVREKE